MLALKFSSSNEAWLKRVPKIKINRPRDDICKRCKGHRNRKCKCLRKQVIDTVTYEKLAATEMFHKHLKDAKKEPSHDKTCIENSVK